MGNHKGDRLFVVARIYLFDWFDLFFILALLFRILYYSQNVLHYRMDDILFRYSNLPQNFLIKKISTRLRWRDSEAFIHMPKNGYDSNYIILRPLVDETRNSIFGSRTWVQPVENAENGPSLEDMDLIDVLWRRDIDLEKATSNFLLSTNVAEQYERDLQLITEKSLALPLPNNGHCLHENVYKSYYPKLDSILDTFDHNSPRSSPASSSNIAFKEKIPYPINVKNTELNGADLDISTKNANTSQNQTLLIPETVYYEREPILNNVSLTQTMRSNNTDAFDEIFTDAAINFNETDNFATPTTSFDEISNNYWSNSQQVQNDFGDDQLTPNGCDLPLETPVNLATLSNPISYETGLSNLNEHNYAVGIDPPAINIDRHSMMPVASLDYDEDSTGSRVSGKLLPAKMDIDKERNGGEDVRLIPRRRGRQSKDDQLVISLNLPVRTAQIVHMSLAEFQKLVSNQQLDDQQRSLIKKIRRRGKNNVAAQTCREKRGANIAILKTETMLLIQERDLEAKKHAKLRLDVKWEQQQIDELQRRLNNS